MYIFTVTAFARTSGVKADSRGTVGVSAAPCLSGTSCSIIYTVLELTHPLCPQHRYTRVLNDIKGKPYTHMHACNMDASLCEHTCM